MTVYRTLFLGFALLSGLACLAADEKTPPGEREIWRIDFEKVQKVEELKTLSWGKNHAQLVKREQGGGTCLEISMLKAGTLCALDLRMSITIVPHLVLAFDHREEIVGEGEGTYHGMSFYSKGKQAFWHKDRFGAEWRHVEIPLTQLEGRFGTEMVAGLILDRIQLYGRSKDQKKRGDNPCVMKVRFDNIRLFTNPAALAIQSGKSYTCHNNPPLLDWRGETAPGTRLQYSMDERFLDDTTTMVTLSSPRPYYVPQTPLTPGAWYFRRCRSDDSLERWTRIEKLVIPDQTHGYRVPPFDPSALRKRPRPRLLARIRPDGEPVAEAERRQLVKHAERMRKQGVPEHPGPWKKDDPRWPHWIDWYGKVAGQVTSRTGSRLVKAARAAILTRDPTAIAASKELLLAACAWDPKGGSSARRGDLQAASLLKGMVWCYDACEETLSDAEREEVHEILRVRILQFYTRISPFRINPAQNHPWKKNTVVAEAALVLIGEFPEAEEWLDVTIRNFCYRILPSMGFQGENQEGISYWSYGVNMLANFADLLLLMADLDLYDHPWLRQTCRFPIYLTPPNAYAISFADNSPRGNVYSVGPAATGLAGLLGARSKDPYALWYANRADRETGFRAPADLPQSIFYPFIGYSLFHTCLSEGLESVDVGMRSGPYHAGHQHDDNNGFVIHAYGDKLAIDGGYYDWYGSPHFKAYSQKTLAHNTLLVNGKNQARGTDGVTTSFLDSPSFGYTLGDAGSNPKIYENQLRRFDRRLIFLKPGFVIVHDLVESAGEPVTLDWLLHSHTDKAFSADSATRTFTIERPKARLLGRFLAPAALNLRVEKSFKIGPQKPRESVFLPESEVQPEWTMFARPQAAEKTEEFLAVMQVQRAEDSTAPAVVKPLDGPDLRGCEIAAPYGVYTFVSRKLGTSAGVAALGGLETDGTCAAVLLDGDGAVYSAFVIDATVLRFRGRTLLESDTRRNWALDDGQAPETVDGVLLVDGERVEMEGRRHRLPSGDLSTWWATVSSSERRPCDLKVHGWTGARPPRVRLGRQTLTGTELTVPLSDKTSCLTVTGCGSFEKITLAPRRFTIVPAETLTGKVLFSAADIVIDTDNPMPSAQSSTKGKVMKKVGALGSSAFCCIDGPVQWAEWTFEVKTAGEFEMLVRGTSEHEVIERQIRIDGVPAPAPDTSVRMVGTGGWCRETDDWQWSLVKAAKGKQFSVKLDPGTHTLRWEFVVGSQNIDQFVLRRLRP
ncbi:MAG: DUF4962 domain-containing protein [Lentisphaeria bacterium]|nr:DUF4962 domain-containing protein [Lentisphaeria bacterium]